jgi:hypothetical protein
MTMEHAGIGRLLVETIRRLVQGPGNLGERKEQSLAACIGRMTVIVVARVSGTGRVLIVD